VLGQRDAVAALLALRRAGDEATGGTLYVEQFLVSPSASKDAWRLRLHHFVRGDQDRELHSHPWYGVSLILLGGYREEYRETDHDPLGVPTHRVRERSYGPLSVNVITPETFHRVDLIERDAWTIFLSSPQRGSWGFWSRATGVYEDYLGFFKRMNLGETNFGEKS